MRALFGASTLISDEYSGYLFSWLTLASFLFGMRTKAFLRVEFVVGRLRGGSRAVVEVFAALAGLIVAGVICYASSVLTLTTWKFNALSSQYSQTPLYIPQLVMPLAFALLSVAYLAQLLTLVDELRRPAAGRESRDA